jgi:hypothetical protein
MASPSASSGAESGIQAPGGSITKGPNLVLFAIIAVVVIFYLWRKK